MSWNRYAAKGSNLVNVMNLKCVILLCATALVGASITGKMERGQRLEMWEVVELSRKGVADEQVLAYLKRQGGVYLVGDSQAGWLRELGVSEVVVDFMRAIPKDFRLRNYPKGYVLLGGGQTSLQTALWAVRNPC